jgi:predicted nucleic acid-binding protein
MTVILIDTNVLVYAFDNAEPGKRACAMEVILNLQSHSLGCLSVQCLSEFFNATTRGATPKLTVEEALRYVQDYLLALPTFPLTQSIVLAAARGVRDHSLSYYDAQIWASAMINDIRVVFSEDFSDGRIVEGVRFVNPFAETFDLEKWL